MEKCLAGCLAHMGVCLICQINAHPGPAALDNLLMCSTVPWASLLCCWPIFIISLIAVLTQLSERRSIGGSCVSVFVRLSVIEKSWHCLFL